MTAHAQPLSTQRGSDPSEVAPFPYAGGRQIDDWRPEDPRFWASTRRPGGASQPLLGNPRIVQTVVKRGCRLAYEPEQGSRTAAGTCS